MICLYISTLILLLISFAANRKKTVTALKIAWMKFRFVLPAFTEMIIIVSVVIYLVPDSLILKYLGKSGIVEGTLFAAAAGSVTVMPGFLAFPLSGILIKKGVSYTVISAFTTTLMMVGVFSFPFERKFLGTGVSVIRNLTALVTALTVAFFTGIFYGEIF